MKTIASVTICKGRLHHLRQTLPLLVALGTSEVIVVDYGCPDRSGDWVEANFPGVTVVRVTDDPGFSISRARNIGASQASADWLLFVDADIFAAAGWHGWMQDQLQPGNFYRRALVEGIRDSDTHGTAICARADLAAMGGYDEVYRGWGGEDDDLYQRLILMGVAEREYPAGFVTAIKHGDEERSGWSGLSCMKDVVDLVACYLLAKIETMKVLGITGDLPFDLRVQYMEHTRRELTRWLSENRSYPLRIRFELEMQDQTVGINIDLPY